MQQSHSNNEIYRNRSSGAGTSHVIVPLNPLKQPAKHALIFCPSPHQRPLGFALIQEDAVERENEKKTSAPSVTREKNRHTIRQ